MLELLKWLSKAIIAINWFSVDVQVGIILAEHINEWKCIKHTSYYMYHKTPEHALKSYLSLSWMDIEKNILEDTSVLAAILLE